VGVIAHHHIGRLDGLKHLRVQRARDRRGEAGRDRHGEKGRVQSGAVRKSEAHVRGAAGRVHAELLAQPADDPEHLPPRAADGSDRHDERIDDDVLPGDPVIGCARDDPAGNLEALVRVLGDARLVVRDRDDRGAVLRHER
jgi:hypothetical protein